MHAPAAPSSALFASSRAKPAIACSPRPTEVTSLEATSANAVANWSTIKKVKRVQQGLFTGDVVSGRFATIL